MCSSIPRSGLSFISIILFFFIGCNLPSQEQKLQMVLQKPKGTEIDSKFVAVIDGFHKNMRKGFYKEAIKYFSNSLNYDVFSELANAVYLFEKALSNPKFIGEDMVFFRSVESDNKNIGKIVTISTSMFTTHGWLTYNFILRNDSQDNKDNNIPNWKVVCILPPILITEQEFNSLK